MSVHVRQTEPVTVAEPVQLPVGPSLTVKLSVSESLGGEAVRLREVAVDEALLVEVTRASADTVCDGDRVRVHVPDGVYDAHTDTVAVQDCGEAVLERVVVHVEGLEVNVVAAGVVADGVGWLADSVGVRVCTLGVVVGVWVVETVVADRECERDRERVSVLAERERETEETLMDSVREVVKAPVMDCVRDGVVVSVGLTTTEGLGVWLGVPEPVWLSSFVAVGGLSERVGVRWRLCVRVDVGAVDREADPVGVRVADLAHVLVVGDADCDCDPLTESVVEAEPVWVWPRVPV